MYMYRILLQIVHARRLAVKNQELSVYIGRVGESRRAGSRSAAKGTPHNGDKQPNKEGTRGIY